MKYQIDWLENKTSKAGRAYKVLTLKKEDGSKVDATVFSSFINFANLKPGDSIDGELKGNEYNGKMTYVLEMPNSAPRFAPRVNKSEEIKQAQERKSESIAYFNSVNSAIALISALNQTGSMTTELTQSFIVKWRDWFLSEYDSWNNTPF